MPPSVMSCIALTPELTATAASDSTDRYTSKSLALSIKDAEKRVYKACIADGAEQKAIETAKNLIIKNIPLETIAECTGLSLETIEQIAKEII